MKKIQSSLICLILIVSVAAANGCFITNCPPGGKRSGASSSNSAGFRQCESCGPHESGGRCYGPNICCSSEFGCLIGTPDSLSCAEEIRFPTPCKNQGPSCSGGSGSNQLSINGQCAAEGICCSTETCTFDENCQNFSGIQLHQQRHFPPTEGSSNRDFQDEETTSSVLSNSQIHNFQPLKISSGRRIIPWRHFYEKLLKHRNNEEGIRELPPE